MCEIKKNVTVQAVQEQLKVITKLFCEVKDKEVKATLVPEQKIPEVKNELLQWFREHHAHCVLSVEKSTKYSEELRDRTIRDMKEFFEIRSFT